MLGLFARCYATQVVGFSGVMQWQRIALPQAGSVSEQDAWLLAALEYVRNVYNRLEVDLATKRRNTTESESKRRRG